MTSTHRQVAPGWMNNVLKGAMGASTSDIPYRGTRFLIVFLVVNLHVLRNIPQFGQIYLVLWGVVTVMVSLDFHVARRRGLTTAKHWLVTWVVVGLVGLFGSLISPLSVMGAFYGLARFWFALPVYVALLAYVRTERDLVRYVGWTVVFFFIAVATIPLQVAIGPISWFAEASERGAYPRYASLLGGLNAAGGAAAAYVVLAQYMTTWWKWVLTAGIACCVVIDLSKSGIVSIGVGLVVVAFLNRRHVRSMLVGFGALLVTGLVLYLAMPVVRLRLETSLLSFGLQSDSGLSNSDHTVIESAVDRLTYLPLHNLQAWVELGNPLHYLVGGGFGMASTALVPSGDSLAPMAHNQYVEMLTVFGVVGTTLLLGALLGAVGRLWWSWNGCALPRASRHLFLAVLLLLLARFTFANGALYHPISATSLFLCLFAAGVRSWPGDTSAQTAADRRSP